MLQHTYAYKKAAELIRPLIGKSQTIDALSSYEFYKQRLVQCPVTVVSHIQEFLEHKIEKYTFPALMSFGLTIPYSL